MTEETPEAIPQDHPDFRRRRAGVRRRWWPALCLCESLSRRAEQQRPGTRGLHPVLASVGRNGVAALSPEKATNASLCAHTPGWSRIRGVLFQPEERLVKTDAKSFAAMRHYFASIAASIDDRTRRLNSSF